MKVQIMMAGYVVIVSLTAYGKAVSFTLEDRERIIRLEEGQKFLQQQINDLKSSTQQQINDLKSSTQQQIKDLKSSTQQQITDLKSSTQQQIHDLKSYTQQQINDLKQDVAELKNFMLWGFGITFAGIFALIGFVLWDRRTALAPAVRKNRELEEREERIEKILKEYAQIDPRLKEIMKSAGLL